jgi:hypothetical protein
MQSSDPSDMSGLSLSAEGTGSCVWISRGSWMHVIVVPCRLVALRKVTRCGLDLAGNGEGAETGFCTLVGETYVRLTGGCISGINFQS